MYQRIGKAAYKADLGNTIALDNYLGKPHKSFPSIHVAGTNGKGSTCHMLASVLQQAGYKVGLYTSPHLKDFRERIKVNGRMCSEEFVTTFVAAHRQEFEKIGLSFFEMTVGMAFSYFKQEQVDIAIIETGLGGRLDSTNIITPLLSIITNIDKDHVGMLGNTITAIASEKAGIIKEKVPVMVGERRGWLRARFRESAQTARADIRMVDHRITAYPTDLRGVYQSENSRTAIQSLKWLKERYPNFHISETDMLLGMQSVVQNTGLRGRYEQISANPKVIVETAHNPAGIAMLNEQLATEAFSHLHIVIGMVADKDVDKVISLLPQRATYHIATPNVARGLKVEELAGKMKNSGLNFEKYSSVSAALDGAKSLVNSDDLIIVTGSVFVVAEVI